MRGSDLKTWAEHMGFKDQKQAAKALGYSRRQYQEFLATKGDIPYCVEQTCINLAFGIKGNITANKITLQIDLRPNREGTHDGR